MTHQHKRRIKLILPSFQLRLTAAFVGMSALALIVQMLMFASFMSELALELPDGGQYLATLLPGFLGRLSLFSFGLLLPSSIGIGVLITFRIAGPLFRIERHLEEVSRGEDPGPCRLRKGDQLQRLCRLVNEATDTLRGAAAATSELAPEVEDVKRAG